MGDGPARTKSGKLSSYRSSMKSMIAEKGIRGKETIRGWVCRADYPVRPARQLVELDSLTHEGDWMPVSLRWRVEGESTKAIEFSDCVAKFYKRPNASHLAATGGVPGSS